jgi:serine/threonine protein kinase
MKAGELETADFLLKVCGIADALCYAASEGIVHRDIKPANIMIDSRGRPQIMDFGLAEVALAGQASTGGRIAGTPAYMSPEQARGTKTVTPASDQYSLGAILYEGVTGTRSVRLSGAAAISEIASRDSLPMEPLHGIPTDLVCIIKKSMASHPEARYPDCQDMANDLRAYLDGFPVSARRTNLLVRVAKWSRRDRLAAGLLVAVLLMLVGIASMSSVVAISNQWRNEQLAEALDLAERKSQEADIQTDEAKKQAQNS